MKEYFAQYLSRDQIEALMDKVVDWLITTVPSVLLVLLLTILVYILFRFFVRRLKRFLMRTRAKKTESLEDDKRIDTLASIVSKAGSAVIWIIATLVLLREIGVEIGPILAGAGVLGLAVGFGAQNLVRDVISGFFILLEDQVRVGDVAELNGTGGLVEEINLRTIVMRDLEGTVHIFPHGVITSVSNKSKEWTAAVFDMGVAYKEDTDKVVEVMKDVASGLRRDPAFSGSITDDIEVFGVDDFADSAVVIKARIKTKPLKQWDVGREYRRRIKKAFDDRGIEIPFPHMSIYSGEATRPMPVRMEKA
jgi:small-conductance mechanosensitive channel